MTAQASGSTAKYSQKLTRGGALLSEMRTLLNAWQPGETASAFVARVRRDGVLGKATARTIEDYVGAFARRFLTPTDTPARHLRELLSGTPPRQVFEDLVFYYTAHEDSLLRDFTVLHYWPAARDGRLTLSKEDVTGFLWEAHQGGRIPERWSDEVMFDLPARVLNVLADFGLLGNRTGPRREMATYRATDGTVAYLAYLLHAAGVTDASIAEQSDWAIFGLQPPDVWNRLQALAGEGWLIFQRAGQVVRVTWRYESVEEVVHALSGR